MRGSLSRLLPWYLNEVEPELNLRYACDVKHGFNPELEGVVGSAIGYG